MPETPSIAASVSASYHELTSTAGILNRVSDALGKAVSDIDDGLKKLNLGITVWVRVACDGPDYPEDPFYRIDEIGYAKINGKWGIALKTVSGSEQDPPGEESVETWPFNEAPRALRLKAIEKTPELFKKLNEEAAKAANELKDKLGDVLAVAAAINPPTNSAPKKRTLLQSLAETQVPVVGLEQTPDYGTLGSGKLTVDEGNVVGATSFGVKK
jgi:hypothetical protein